MTDFSIGDPVYLKDTSNIYTIELRRTTIDGPTMYYIKRLEDGSDPHWAKEQRFRVPDLSYILAKDGYIAVRSDTMVYIRFINQCPAGVSDEVIQHWMDYWIGDTL